MGRVYQEIRSETKGGQDDGRSRDAHPRAKPADTKNFRDVSQSIYKTVGDCNDAKEKHTHF